MSLGDASVPTLHPHRSRPYARGIRYLVNDTVHGSGGKLVDFNSLTSKLKRGRNRSYPCGRFAMALVVSDSASLIIVEELGLLRDDLDDAGLAFLSGLGVIAAPERELPNVGQRVADSTGRQNVLACSLKVM